MSLVTCTPQKLIEYMDESQAWIKQCEDRIEFLRQHPEEKYMGEGWIQWFSVSALESEISMLKSTWRFILSDGKVMV